MGDITPTATLGSLVERGLTAPEVADRVGRGQVNDVPAAATRTVWQIVQANIFTLFNALLGSMLVLILLLGSYRDALFGIVLVANSAIGIVQELRAKRTLDRLAVLTAPRAKVVRDGQMRDLAVGEVVLDDVLEAAIGDQIVFDGQALAVQGFQVDESLLTGESDPVEKAPGDEVLSGSFAMSGSGRYQATRVGRAAYAARLAEEARRFTLTKSELRDGTNRILKYVSWIILPTGILLFWSQLRVQGSLRHAISGAVAGTVAMVPEGLVLLMSIAFAAAVVRLGKRRVLVQELPTVEVLARVDVLCIDKTGTLTEGTVAVSSVEPLNGATAADVEAALAAIAANDRAPNPTTRALIARFANAPHGWVATHVVPFSSARKWNRMSFEERGAWILGAPDVLLRDGEADPVVREKAERIAAEGQRVVLLARAGALPGDQLPPDLTPVGLVILGERLRLNAADTSATSPSKKWR